MKKLLFIFSFLSFFGLGCSNAQTTTVAEFEKGMSKKDVQLIDVRTPDEYNEGHLKNARLMNVNDESFDANIATLDKNKPVYVYCRSGHRSHIAYTTLKEKGFKNVVELKGGIMAWEAAGKEVVAGK